MGLRVLVTRPRPAADRTAATLRKLGFEPLVLPLTEVVGLPIDPARLDDDFGAAAVTSANALRFASAALLGRLAPLPLHAVGAATAGFARKLGLAPEPETPGNAVVLAGVLAGRLPRGAHVLYPCGRVRLDDFEALLAGAGIEVRPFETYDTLDRDPTGEELAALAGDPPAVALLYSPHAAMRLSGLLARPDLGRAFALTRFCCLSRRVADNLPGWARAVARVAEAPEERSLLDLLPVV